MTLKRNYSIPMIGQNYLSVPEPNTLCSPPSIMMVTHCGPIKLLIKLGVSHGTQLRLAQNVICWVTCLHPFARHLCVRVCTIRFTSGSTHYGKVILRNLLPSTHGRR